MEKNIEKNIIENFNIKINDYIETLGLVTFQIRKEEREDEPYYEKIGILKTHLYIEEINTIECDRFKIDGIDVYLEAFGSSDIFNLYHFTYDSFEILDNKIKYEEEYLIEQYQKEVI